MICIPTKAGDIMLPCKQKSKEGYDKGGGGDGRKLLWHAGDTISRRVLAPGGGGDYCSKYSKVPLISQSGVHQLHIFIFVLAVFHVLYSVLTMGLARAKMKKWKAWEQETTSLEYQFTSDPSRFRLTHQTSFVRRHSGLSTTPGLRWINAFQMAYFLWIWYEFGLTSCFHENLAAILARVFVGVALQILCSYITFPLYALVTQMGSHMKKAIFEEQTAKALKKWQKAAKERKKLRKAGADVPLSGEVTPSHSSSPIHLLHKYKHYSTDIESLGNSPNAYHSEMEFSEVEVEVEVEVEGPPLVSSDDHHKTKRTANGDFSFSKTTDMMV
ncbi:hypothetical protein F0562_006770 [Nyssa sinensis]|uniref:MLO-like protein n=1 Tax=Nyssa sinensis TaxID=561372 RepID=A0A5J5APG9_9ASTE|nr:hypothetical protein F0562_006770 [Nyssa sinensis]